MLITKILYVDIDKEQVYALYTFNHGKYAALSFKVLGFVNRHQESDVYGSVYHVDIINLISTLHDEIEALTKWISEQ